MTSLPLRRCVMIQDSFVYGDEGQVIDPAEIEASRLHLAAVTGLDVRFVHYDRLAMDDAMYCHVRFLEQIAQLRPEFIWYHPNLFSYLIHRNIRPEILFAARALYGAKLVLSFGDLGYDFLAIYAAGYAAIADVSVTWDGNAAMLAPRAPGKTVLDLWTPTDARAYNDPGLSRDIDVCFAGSYERYQDRKDMLRDLGALGVPVVTGGGDQGRFLDRADYAAILQRSKISLNFSLTMDGRSHQLKGRTLESILCGALLFESENAVTARFLEPYRHYIPFGDAADLHAKIRRYLADGAARRKIVDDAKAHVTANLSEDLWWRRIVETLDQARIEAIQRRQQAKPAP